MYILTLYLIKNFFTITNNTALAADGVSDDDWFCHGDAEWGLGSDEITARGNAAKTRSDDAQNCMLYDVTNDLICSKTSACDQWACSINGNFIQKSANANIARVMSLSSCQSSTNLSCGYTGCFWAATKCLCVQPSAACHTFTWYRDEDLDGYGGESQQGTDCGPPTPSGWVSQGGDCNDQNGGVYQTGQALSPRWPDNDGDLYGNPQFPPRTFDACEPRISGWAYNSKDCDDTNPNINPEVKVTWYADQDSDGFGDARHTSKANACVATNPGWVKDNTDCDDNQSQVHPGISISWWTDADGDDYGTGTFENRDICSPSPSGKATKNGDCDDTNADVNPSVTITVYTDQDHDGFGASNSQTALVNVCAIPVGKAANNTDCDDSNVAINPSSMWFVDSDGDREGLVTSGKRQCVKPGANWTMNNQDCNDQNSKQNSHSTWYFDQDHDGWGDTLVTQVACDQPTGYVWDSGDCNDRDASLSPDTLWFVDHDHDGFGGFMVAKLCVLPPKTLLGICEPSTSSCVGAGCVPTPSTVITSRCSYDTRILTRVGGDPDDHNASVKPVSRSPR